MPFLRRHDIVVGAQQMQDWYLDLRQPLRDNYSGYSR
jgi:hypothetical protein